MHRDSKESNNNNTNKQERGGCCGTRPRTDLPSSRVKRTYLWYLPPRHIKSRRINRIPMVLPNESSLSLCDHSFGPFLFLALFCFRKNGGILLLLNATFIYWNVTPMVCCMKPSQTEESCDVNEKGIAVMFIIWYSSDSYIWRTWMPPGRPSTTKSRTKSTTNVSQEAPRHND